MAQILPEPNVIDILGKYSDTKRDFLRAASAVVTLEELANGKDWSNPEDRQSLGKMIYPENPGLFEGRAVDVFRNDVSVLSSVVPAQLSAYMSNGDNRDDIFGELVDEDVIFELPMELPFVETGDEKKDRLGISAVKYKQVSRVLEMREEERQRYVLNRLQKSKIPEAWLYGFNPSNSNDIYMTLNSYRLSDGATYKRNVFSAGANGVIDYAKRVLEVIKGENKDRELVLFDRGLAKTALGQFGYTQRKEEAEKSKENKSD